MTRRVWQRVDEPVHQMSSGRSQLGVLSAARVDAELFASKHRRDVVGIEPGAVDDGRRRDVLKGRVNHERVANAVASKGGTADDEHDVPLVAQVFQRIDECFRLEDARRSGPQRRRRPNVGLACAHEISVDELQVLDVVGLTPRIQRFKLLGVAGG